MRRWIVSAAFLSVVCAVGCGGAGSTPASPPCDQTCQDSTALLSLRDALKLIFNLKLQGAPVGAQDQTGPCPLGGTAHVFGQATSNAVQGSTNVQLTYVLDHCAYLNQDTDPSQTFNMTLTGTITEVGTLAVQPSSTTALELQSDSMTFAGTVYAPPIDYQGDACPLTLSQNGNQLAGTMCGRNVGVSL